MEGTIAEGGKHPSFFLQNKNLKDYEELIFRGNIIDAKEAHRIGLVNSVVKNPLNEAIKIGEEIADNSRNAVSVSKKFINFNLDEDFKDLTEDSGYGLDDETD